jgi:hypothetical protein
MYCIKSKAYLIVLIMCISESFTNIFGITWDDIVNLWRDSRTKFCENSSIQNY